VDAWTGSESEEEEGVSGSESEGEGQGEQEVLIEESEQTTTTSGSPIPNQAFPSASGPLSTSPTIQQRELGHGLSPRNTTHMLPPISRTRSRGRAYTPQSPAIEEGATVLPGGAPISRTSSRRGSGHSMSGRRPASFLFSPFGSGMTPLPSMIGSQSQGSNLASAPGSSTTASTATSATGTGPGTGATMGHGHSASVDYYSGRRSRAPSTTGGDYSLRPLIRQLSTVGMGVGGDDGVPVAGGESAKAGLGLDGVNVPPHAYNRPMDQGGDDGLPPMRVSPSDEPASTVNPDL
jgi:hypothetical protein